MGIIGKRVEKQIGQPMAGQMILQFDARRENNALVVHAAGHSLGEQVLPCFWAILDEPQYAARDPIKKPHPDIEYRCRDFPIVIEATEDKAFFGQSNFAPCRSY